MKSILAIEAGNRQSSVAVWSECACIFEEVFTSARRETGPLFSTVHRALQSTGEVELIAVGTGPGSYNGLRAAISLAEGLSLGRGIPCAGWSSLLCFPQNPRILAGDARSGQSFFAVVENHRFLCEPELIASCELESRIASLPGAETSELCWVGENPPTEAWTSVQPSARELCFVALRDAATPGFQTGRVLPIYLKPPHITRPAK